MNFDREQFERLLSERADGHLSPDQLAELDRAIAGNAEFAGQARAYERLQTLLRGWRTVPADLDWRGLSARIRQSIDEPALQTTTRTVDDLVQAAFGPMPDVDWVSLKARISSAVREEAASRRSRRSWSSAARWTALVGAPLAAAAVIALAIWMPRSAAPTSPPTKAPAQSMVVVSFETPQPAGKVKIAFDEKPYKGPVADEANGAAIANGPSQMGARERVEEVVLY